MFRIERNVQTGAVTVIPLTQAELDAAAVAAAVEIEYSSLDNRSIRAVDSIDRLQFEHLFDLENRMRAQESLAQITRAQYRTALINRWKALHS